MRTVKIAGLTFELLNQTEAREATKDCDHDWQPATKAVVINPACEYVKGYGSQFVTVQIAGGRICQDCGLLEIDSELDKAIQSGKLDSILAIRSRKQTICQMLRDLRENIPEYRDQLDTCLLIAKKMNDKLVEYAGTTAHATSWYDEEGNFIEE